LVGFRLSVLFFGFAFSVLFFDFVFKPLQFPATGRITTRDHILTLTPSERSGWFPDRRMARRESALASIALSSHWQPQAVFC
jgi:hypothetical protein